MKPYYNKDGITIFNGDCLQTLKEISDESIDMCITSPPYWALRDYGVNGQLGLENSFQEYINKLCNIFDEVKRVLKKTGCCYVNLGDTYMNDSSYSKGGGQGFGNDKIGMIKKDNKQCPKKSLCQIPSRFAIEMTNRGWILRNEIIWHKPNCMPSSAKDRFTVDFEKIFFFTKNKKYFFEPQFESFLSNSYDIERMAKARSEYGNGKWSKESGGSIKTQRAFVAGGKNGRNKRCVWSINTKPFKEAHFATYPEKLIEIPIKASCPEFICTKCGNIKEKIFKKGEFVQTGGGRKKDTPGLSNNQKISAGYHQTIESGYTDCDCKKPFISGTILDPFCGSGTTAVVAKHLKRKMYGIEINKYYCDISIKRIDSIQSSLI